MELHSIIPQALGTGDSPTFTAVTATRLNVDLLSGIAGSDEIDPYADSTVSFGINNLFLLIGTDQLNCPLISNNGNISIRPDGGGGAVRFALSGGTPLIGTAVASDIDLLVIADGTGTVTVESTVFDGTSVTSTGLIQAEQLTSTDDITMQGHLLTLGNNSSAADVVIDLLSSGNDAKIAFTQASTELDITDASLHVVIGVSDFRFSQGASDLTPTMSVINTGATGEAAALLAGTLGAQFQFSDTGYFAIAKEAKSEFLANTLSGAGETILLKLHPGGGLAVGSIQATDPGTDHLLVGGANLSAITSISGASPQLRLHSTNADAATRNWTLALDNVVFGDFQIRQSDARLGDAWSAGTTRFRIDASGDTIISGNATIGAGAADIDYTLTFDGETNDGVITWMEDEDRFSFADAVTINGTLTITDNSVLSSDSAVFQPNADSTTFFQILDQDGGTPILNVDTTNERVGINNSSPSARLDVGGTVRMTRLLAGGVTE